MASVTLTLPQMIDCALCYPETGSVNFQMLHSVLQVVVQQLELLSCNVEFKGKEGDVVKNLIEVSKNAPKATLTEFVVTPASEAGKHLSRGKKGKQADPNTVHIDDIGAEEDLQTVVVVETGNATVDEEPMVISKSKIDDLQKQVSDLKRSLKELSEMPANQTLINAIRQAESGKGTPILEIFQSLSLMKRMDANDAQVQKLAVMIEDLVKSNPNLGCPPGVEGAETVCDYLKILDGKVTALEQAIQSGGLELPKVDKQTSSDVEVAEKPSKPTDVPEPTVSVPDFTQMDLDSFKKSVYEQLKSIREDIKKLFESMSGIRTVMQQCTIEEIIAAVKGAKGRKAKKEGDASLTTTQPAEPDDPAGTSERLTELEGVFQNITEQIASLDTTFNNEFQNLQTQFAEMEKEFGSLMEKVHVGIPGGEGQVSGETIGELYEKIIGIQTDMESLADTASKLMDDKEQKEKLMDLLTEQIDMLKTVKADKEDLEDALADKADACAINRKVSHDQFDTACDELSKGIEEALAKLTQQEQLWQAALDEIQREIGNKLDRMELGPLRDFINQKLKVLQQRLKALMALKQETEAAGTKKFLKNVQCISCDKDVVMRKEMDPSLLPQAYALPPSRSMGPYLAYELDALRKQQKALPTSRNLNHFESALHSKSPRPGDDHICNRYCGGSHTITTPQQRVTRLGHFLNQWGPEAQPMCETTKDDEGPLIITGRGTDRKPAAQPDQATPKQAKEAAGGDAAPASPTDKKDPKELKETKETKETKKVGTEVKKVPSVKGSKGSVSPKTSPPKVSPKASSTASKATGRRPSQSSSKSGASVEKRGSKTAAPKIPEETPEEVAAESAPSAGEGGEAGEAGEAGESPPPPSEAGGETEAGEATEPQVEEVSPEEVQDQPEE